MIFIHPYNFRVPDWKVLAYYAGLRSLELVATSKEQTIVHPGFSDYHLELSLDVPMIECAYTYGCRVRLRHHDTMVYPEQFDIFFKEALKMWNKVNEERGDILECEKPLPWPVVINNNNNNKDNDNSNDNNNSNTYNKKRKGKGNNENMKNSSSNNNSNRDSKGEGGTQPTKKSSSLHRRIYINNGWENNFVVCEPPSPHCVCCKDSYCMNATQIYRGF